MQNAPPGQPARRSVTLLFAVNSPLGEPALSAPVADGVSLVDELANFLAGRPDGSSEEFVIYLHTVRRCTAGASSPLSPCWTVEFWRTWLEPGDSVQRRLLDFFHGVYGDFRDYDLVQLLERWHRLLTLAGSDWRPQVLERLAERLDRHFRSHAEYRLRQPVCLEDVVFLYRRFGIVPSQSQFDSAARQMIHAVEWSARQFSCLFASFREFGAALSSACRFCRISLPAHNVEFTTVCSLASSRQERHTLAMCAACSEFVRKSTHQPHCPCCERCIVKARHLPL